MASPFSHIVDERIIQIRCASSLSEPPPRARVPNLYGSEPVHMKAEMAQGFINSFEYNYTGKPYVRLNRFKLKSLGMLHITLSAKKIICESLPIQCVEAVFLGCVLTAHIPDLLRIPLSFKSKMGTSIHRHIVLALRYEGKWGALGISRRDTLMDKPIVFESLADLIKEYRDAYTVCQHTLLKVYVGFPFSSNCFNDIPIKWRAVNIRISGQSYSSIRQEAEHFLGQMDSLQQGFETEQRELALLRSSLR
jgi:hypothetical protein